MGLNIAYSCNEGYIEQTGISILSLLENNKNVFDQINIYFIGKDVITKSINNLKEIADNYNANLVYLDFNELCKDLTIDKTGRHIETVYAKLFFTDLLNIDRIIYIDSDTIINGSLKEFWEVELNDNLVGGVSTHTVGSKKILGLTDSDVFINDGVVLMNIKKLKEESFKEKFLECIASYNGNPPVLSEGVINKVCRGRIKVLNPKFNLMSGLITYNYGIFNTPKNFYPKEELLEAINNPTIIHFLAGFYNRPWHVDCTHPMKNLYFLYKRRTIWKDTELKKRKLPLRIKLIGWMYRNLPVDFVEFFRKMKNV